MQHYKDEICFNKLQKIEKKLKALDEFVKQSELLREARKKLFLHVRSSTGGQTENHEPRRVTFGTKERGYSVRSKSNITQIQVQRSKSLHSLLTNLQTWHSGIKTRKSEIELLKNRKESLSAQQTANYDQMITKLEQEKDELDEKILLFVLRNIEENKEDYFDLVNDLENENKGMEDRILILQRQIDFLKETNIALLRANHQMKLAHALSPQSSFDIEDKFNAMMRTSSIMLPEMVLYDIVPEKMRSSSMQIIHELEQEDMLSLDQTSVDSFNLDTQMVSWKMDEKSIQENLTRLASDLHVMEITQMKLNLIKRYVRKHGTKHINRNTFIDPEERMSLWHC